MVEFVDLFCGAGGLSVGFTAAGAHPIFANDIDEHAAATFRHNHPETQVFVGDVSDISGDRILSDCGVAKVSLVVGGPNCQGVSLRGKRDPNDPKNLMFGHFRRIIGELRPDWFVMENVPGLLHRHNRGLLTDIFCAFDEIGYRCGAEVLLAADYGVPQLRYRLLLVGNRHGQRVTFPSPTHRPLVDGDVADLFAPVAVNRPGWVSVRDAISDLPVIRNGGGREVVEYKQSQRELTSRYQLDMRKGSRRLVNHVCHLTAEHNLELIRHIPQGGNWRQIPIHLRPDRFRHVALKDHTTTYGRLRWDMPARTVTTYFNNISAGAFTHPTQLRGISVREGARLQGFPDKIHFVGPLARQYRQVGNAVPPLLAQRVAEHVLKCMTDGDLSESRTAAIEYQRASGMVVINRPIQGMRFNLDKHLVQR